LLETSRTSWLANTAYEKPLMKNLIQINLTSFILGAVFGGLAVFTVAVGHRPTHWRYRVVEQDAKYFHHECGTEEIAKAATNGWEFVSAQIIPNPPGGVMDGARVMIIQKQPKE
jgi:hypothetical protein